ncbi:RNA polymerase sigma factor [Paractinoplanes rishiriensis]|uniref:RNA polymerase sigma24 factor n=1 Tax=Paractinoplanes rishiriensis TaxID=1050105 RepID=A0A919MWR5_9ACTN|nr:RNA polymerase sigma factor [Actinoplanes rishiriensis]GIE98108.1 RNA polymerase sigma24 factor [Actinoplanes rishiriensis]
MEQLTALVSAARDGDEAAFAELYNTVQPGLLRYLRALVGQDAEDVASETWLQISRELPWFRGRGSRFRTWVATVARRRALEHLRARDRQTGAAVPSDEVDLLPTTDHQTESEAVAAVGTDAALRLIMSLPPDQAEAVLLRVVLDLDATESGRVLGKRAGAVRIAAHRGLRRLEDILERRAAAGTLRSEAIITPRTGRTGAPP